MPSPLLMPNQVVFVHVGKTLNEVGASDAKVTRFWPGSALQVGIMTAPMGLGRRLPTRSGAVRSGTPDARVARKLERVMEKKQNVQMTSRLVPRGVHLVNTPIVETLVVARYTTSWLAVPLKKWRWHWRAVRKSMLSTVRERHARQVMHSMDNALAVSTGIARVPATGFNAAHFSQMRTSRRSSRWSSTLTRPS